MHRAIRNRTLVPLVLVVAAQLLDLVTFVPAVARVGIGAESNPFARVLYASFGASGPAVLKMTAIAAIVVGLAWVARRFPARLLPTALLVAGIGLAGVASNVLFGLAH